MLAGAFSCHHLNAHRNDEYIVPGASDGDVTNAACPGRILLVEQQVSLPFDQRPKQTYKRLSRRTKPAHRRLTRKTQSGVRSIWRIVSIRRDGLTMLNVESHSGDKR